MAIKKRHNCVSVLLLLAFGFCTISMFSLNTISVEKSQLQVTSHKLPSCDELSLYEETGEDQCTEMSPCRVTTHFLNTVDFRAVFKAPGLASMAYAPCPFSYPNLPIFISVRTLRI